MSSISTSPGEAFSPTTQRAAARAGSWWRASTAETGTRPPLGRLDRVDVAIVGGGIVGATLALLLARDGARVALVEAGRLGGGTTGGTTAKVSAPQGLVHGRLARDAGEDRARAFADANAAALAWMRALVTTEELDCEWRDRDALTYTASEERIDDLRAEAEVCARLGLPASMVGEVPGPTGAVAALRLADQAEMHPRRYVLGLADLAEAAGCTIAEGTRVCGIDAGDPCVLHCDGTTLRADRVVLATLYPLLDRSLHIARVSVQRSYIVGVRAPDPVGAMLYGIDDPMRSLRSTPLPDGHELILVGGEGHATGRETDTEQRYEALAATARDWYPEAPLLHRWSAQDVTSADELPYAEPILGGDGRIFAVTGLRKWGMTLGTAAAHHLADRFAGRPASHAAAFDHPRVPPVRAIAHAARENAGNGIRLVTGRLHPGASSDELEPGQGAVHGPPHRRVAAYRDDDGALHTHAATCTHLGCEVRFNEAERSWDCPCHASRFDARDGRVLTGPATRRLRPARD